MRAADSTDRRALAKAALIGLLLVAPGRAQDSASKGDDVLGWLSGDSQPGQADPAPATPPTTQQPTEVAPPVPAAAPEAPDTAPATAPRPASAAGAAAAQAFADLLKQAMTLEVQVEDYENSTLGAEEHPETLQAYKKQRWERIQKDRAGFRQHAGQMSLHALDIPRPAAGTQLPREALPLLASLQRAYDASRSTRPVEQYIEANQAFLRTDDWTQRDHAVVMRDDIVDREVDFTRLMQDAATLTAGNGDDALLARMTETLDKVAPEARSGGDDLAVLVLKDADLRTQLMNEVSALLTSVPPPPAPPAPDADLRQKVSELEKQMIDAGQLAPVIQEHQQLADKIADLDAQLKTDLPLTRKKTIVGARTAAVARSTELETQWYGTRPDPDTFAALTRTQDELIRRRLLDLGPSGVLYGQRAETLRGDLGTTFEDPAQAWRFVHKQQDLLSLLDGVKPTENPLLGITLPDTTGEMLLKDAQARLAAESKLLAKSAPKPTPKASYHANAAPQAYGKKPKQMPHYHPHYHPPPKKKKK